MGKSKVSTFLTILGAVGVAATAIMAVHDAPKASKLLEKAKLDKGEDLTLLECVKTAVPAYIPTITVGITTVTCILGANVLNKHVQASMASAYSILDSSYKAYRRKVESIYGEGTDCDILSQLAQEEYETGPTDDVPEGELMFWDPNTRQFFYSTVDHVIQKTDFADGMECYIICTPFDTPMHW